MEKKQKIISIVVLVVVTIACAILLIFGTGVRQIKTTVTHEAGENYELKAEEFFTAEGDRLEKVTFDTSAYDRDKAGTYTVIAKYGTKKFEIEVVVEDTMAPVVTADNRYVFINSADTDILLQLDGVYDASGFEVAYHSFEKVGILKELRDSELREMAGNIPVPCNQEELAALETTEFPEQEGIYQVVVTFTDAYGNVRYEEFLVIYDKTGAVISGEDKTIEVATEVLDKVPEIDASDFVVHDNVDGRISSKDVTVEVEAADEEHTYTVTVSYTDRAGNESKSTFMIYVIEKTDSTESGSSGSTSGGGGSSDTGNSSGNSGSTGSGNNGNTGNSGNDGGSSDSGSSGGSGSTGDAGNTDSGSADSSYPDWWWEADADGDGVVSSSEQIDYVNPYERACIEAGYWVILYFPDNGGFYAMVTPDSDSMKDGMCGGSYMLEYLATLDLTGDGHGCWSGADGYYYWCIDDLQELIDENDDEFWD